MFDVEAVRKDFPILKRKVHGKPLVYLDNAATTQKPRQVIEALVDYYENYNANIHRGLHKLAEEATEAYEGSRSKVARFIKAPDSRERHLHPQHHRVAEPCRLLLGPRQP